MHVQAPRRLGYIAPAQLVYPLDMLPPNAVRRHRVLRWLRLAPVDCKKRCCNIIRVRRLREIINSAYLYRGDCGSDVAIPGQNDRTRIRSLAFERRNHVEAIAVLEAH